MGIWGEGRIKDAFFLSAVFEPFAEVRNAGGMLELSKELG